MKKRSSKKYKKRNKFNFLKKKQKKTFNINKNIFAFLLIIITILCFDYINTSQDNFNHTVYTENQEKLESEKEAVEAQTTLLYNNCINEKYNENDLDLFINDKIAEINDYLSNYQVSVAYYNPVSTFSYNYNSNQVYYAASTIKMLDAIYIYENAANGLINLDDTITYKKENKLSASAMMQNYNVGDSVSIRNLVKYAIMVSDNSAHDMLINYIGKSNLKEFGESLGAQSTLIGNDEFGSITTYDSIVYITELNNFINNNPTLGNELKSYFIESDQKYLEIDNLNITAAEKYGQYGNYYHENGIVYASNPYFISILTTEGNNDFESIIRNINMKIYELNNLFYSDRLARCNAEYYQN